MKKSPVLLFYFTGLLLSLVSCNTQVQRVSPKDQEQNTSLELAFSLEDVQNELTRTLNDQCPGFDELQSLIAADEIWAEITIKDHQGQEVDLNDRIALNFVNIGDGQIITDPILFDINFDGTDATSACYYIEQVTIFKSDQDGNPLPLFSSMSSTSENASWIDQSCLLTPYEEATTPTFCLDENNIYQKVTLDVCVYCTYDKDATYFGYIMWNIDFKRMVCVPFSVNLCDEITFQDEIGTGEIEVRRGSISPEGEFVADESVELGIVEFPTDQYTLADLCFFDEMDIPNDDEWYEFIMILDGGRHYRAVTNLTELLTYEDQVEYDAERKFLHFWFCADKDHWFFEPFDCVELPFYFTLPRDNAEIDDYFAHIPVGEPMGGDGMVMGLPGSDELDPEASTILIPAYTKIFPQKSYPFTTDGEYSTTIVLNAPPRTITEGTNIKVTLYNGRDIGSATTVTLIYQESVTSNQFRVNFHDFDDLVSGECYFIMFEINQDFELRTLSIDNFIEPDWRVQP